MKTVESGNFVKIHYTGKYDDGEVFDSSKGCHPLEIHMGSSDLIPGFEKALLGMGVQDKKSFTLTASEAYGERDENLEMSFARDDFPEDFEPEIGQVIVLQSAEQGEFPATVKDINEGGILLDLNHPLAGKDLTFDVEVVEINDQPTESACSCGCSSCS